MTSFNIVKYRIGSKDPFYFIADIAINHDGYINSAYNLIELAMESGVDAAKFQNFVAEKIVSKKGFEHFDRQLSDQFKWEKYVYYTYKEASIS